MKRILPILLILVLLLSVTAWGAPGMSFVAFNDTIPLVLSAGQAPYFNGGVLYVPRSVFATSVAGFHVSYAAGDQYLTLFEGGRRLVFDLINNVVFDENDNYYSATPIGRNGDIYLPAQICTQFFGVQTSYLVSQDGYPIVRFTNGGQVYDDDYFVDVAQNFIAYQVEQTTKPTTPPTPVTPPTKPATPEEEPEEPEVPLEPAKVYFGIIGGENIGDNQKILAEAGYSATVFLTPAQAKTMGDDLRAFAVQGGILGIYAQQWQDVVTANEALVAQGLPATLLVAAPKDLGDSCKTLVLPESWDTPKQVADHHGETSILWTTPDLVATAIEALQEEEAITLPLRENVKLSIPE